MITIVTKSYCPFCVRAKEFLDSLGRDYTEVEISQDEALYDSYKELSWMRTVPQIYKGEPSKDTLIGWYDDMMAKFKAGELFK